MNKYISIISLIMFIGWGSALAQTDYDMFLGENGNITFYQRQNSGSGSFSFVAVTGSSNPLDDVDLTRSKVAFVDIDNDGDLDCFTGKSGGAIQYWKNTGTSTSPTFVEQTGGDNPFNGVNVGAKSDINCVDIDGDGDIDCFIGESSATINYYKNTGNSSSPTFTLTTGGNNPLNITLYSAVTTSFVDIDGDGDIDCFIGELGGEAYYYKNKGNITSPT